MSKVFLCPIGTCPRCDEYRRHEQDTTCPLNVPRKPLISRSARTLFWYVALMTSLVVSGVLIGAGNRLWWFGAITNGVLAWLFVDGITLKD